MKLAIISDIHYPIEVSRQTILYGDCGYTDSFYSNLHEELSALRPDDIDAFIVCGDFFWDYVYFAGFSNWDYTLHIFKLIEFRKFIDPKIPIVFIEGNHDIWFNRYIYSKEGNMYLDIDDFEENLERHLPKYSQAIIETLSGSEDILTIGENMYMLSNSGILINDVYIYGFPYYKKRASKWSDYKGKLIDSFNESVQELLSSGRVKSPVKTVLCHHTHPPTLKLVQAFNQPSVDIRAFYWGHYHNVPQHFIDKLSPHGPYQCVMPEKNSLKFQIYEIQD